MTQNNKLANIINGAGDQTHSGVITDRQAAQLNIKQKEHKMTQKTKEQQHQALIDKLADKMVSITPYGDMRVAINDHKSYEVAQSEWESADDDQKREILRCLVQEDQYRDDFYNASEWYYEITDWDYAD